MSTLYLVLYIFIAVIALLCVVSFSMYLMHICCNNYEHSHRNRSKGHWWTPTTGHVSEDREKLNQSHDQPQCTTGQEQVELIQVRKAVPDLQQEHLIPITHPPPQPQQPQRQLHAAQPCQQQIAMAPQVLSHPALKPIPPSAYPYSTTPPIHNTAPPGNYLPAPEPAVMEIKSVNTVSPRSPAGITPDIMPKPPRTPVGISPNITPKPSRPNSKSFDKPAIPVKPIVHSVPSSKRNSLVQPVDSSLNPPAATIVDPKPPQVVYSSRATVVKPKTAPPPPPVVVDEPLPPPPTLSLYNDVIYDKPETGDYLSDY